MENWQINREDIVGEARICLKQRQNELLRAFKKGGRKNPYVEFVPFEHFEWEIVFDDSVNAILSS